MGRHNLPETHKKYEITQLWSIHHEICRFALLGMKHIDIANHLQISPVTVSYVMRSSIVKRQMSQLQAVRDIDAIDIAKEIQEIAPKAVRKLDELISCGNTAIEFKAATDVLDRAGHAAVRTLRTENIHAHFSADEIADIKKRAKEVGLLTDSIYNNNEEIIDVVSSAQG